VTYVDKFYGCVAFAKKMTKEFDIEDEMKIVKADVFKFMEFTKEKYDYIFAGPPYPLPNLPQIPDLIFKYDLLTPEGLFIMEHNPNHDFKKHPNYVEERSYGKTIFAFFKNVKVKKKEKEEASED